MAFKSLSFDRPIRMPYQLMQTDKNDVKVEKSVGMPSHAFERPCKCQILTDPKSCNTSQISFQITQIQTINENAVFEVTRLDK